VYCSKCGAGMVEGSSFCANCGQSFKVAAALPRAPVLSGAAVAQFRGPGSAPVAAYAGYAAVPRVEYAGFWLRFLALLIDNVVMGLAFVLIFIPLIFLTGLHGFFDEFHPNEDLNDAGIFMLVSLVFLVATASLLLTWLYHALMESSEWQATLGKGFLAWS